MARLRLCAFRGCLIAGFFSFLLVYVTQAAFPAAVGAGTVALAFLICRSEAEDY